MVVSLVAAHSTAELLALSARNEGVVAEEADSREVGREVVKKLKPRPVEDRSGDINETLSVGIPNRVCARCPISALLEGVEPVDGRLVSVVELLQLEREPLNCVPVCPGFLQPALSKDDWPARIRLGNRHVHDRYPRTGCFVAGGGVVETCAHVLK